MKFLVVGLGSMGKRRIRNLKHLKAGEIIGFDIKKERREEAERLYGIKTFDDFNSAMLGNPNVLIISTPPNLHTRYAIIAAKRNLHFFTEASVVDDGMDELISICKTKEIVAAPSCTMRFNPAVQKIRELVLSERIGRPYTFTYHSGQYLPDWHPWEDYRKFYVSQKETGAAREIVSFELVWLTWIFGTVDKISCFKGRVSDLDIDIDDVYQIILKFNSGVIGHMLVDVLSRVPYRSLRIIGREGVIEWNWLTKKINLFTTGENKWSTYEVDEGSPEKGYIAGELMYVEEMRALLNAIEGKAKYPYTLEEDKRILGYLYAAEQSSDKGVHIEFKTQNP